MRRSNIRDKFIEPSLDPQKLQHFLAVYETNSFSAAAKLNGVTQQAISKSIAKLEDSLSADLFSRTAHGAIPTNFADALARRAKVIIAESRLAVAELRALRGAEIGYVKFGLGWSFLSRVAPEVIRRFSERHPGVSISISSGESQKLYKQLLNGDVEFVLSAPHDVTKVDDAIQVERLFADRDALFMRKDHPLARQDKVSLELLAQQEWLVSSAFADQWNHICGVFLSNGVDPPKHHIDIDSVGLMKSLILQSDGIALLAHELVAMQHEKHLYHYFDDTPFPLSRIAQFCTRKNSPLQPLAKNLRLELLNICRELFEPELWEAELSQPGSGHNALL